MCPDSRVLCPTRLHNPQACACGPFLSIAPSFLTLPTDLRQPFSFSLPPKLSTKKHIVHQSVRHILLIFGALPLTFLPATHSPSLEIDPDRQQQSTLSSRSVRHVLLLIRASSLTFFQHRPYLLSELTNLITKNKISHQTVRPLSPPSTPLN
jgi:hypothetical protein